jgi:hypothetical protein
MSTQTDDVGNRGWRGGVDLTGVHAPVRARVNKRAWELRRNRLDVEYCRGRVGYPSFVASFQRFGDTYVEVFGFGESRSDAVAMVIRNAWAAFKAVRAEA